MTEPIRDMSGLVQALRDRRDALNISHETIDAISGLQAGYTSKLLAPKPIKGLGPMSFEAIMGALGVAMVIVEDEVASDLVRDRWTKRRRATPKRGQACRSSISVETQETPEIKAQLKLREHLKLIAKSGGLKGGKRRAKVLGKRARQRIASHAARKRWSKGKSA